MIQTFKNDIINYCNIYERKKYSLWVYEQNDILQVFNEEKLNTKHIWFEFYTCSNLYWKLLQQECIYQLKGERFYNFYKIKQFMINYLLINTNVQGVFIQRNLNGTLTKKSMQSVLSIHPRIMRVLFDMVQIFPQVLTNKEEKEFEKQCGKLFGKGEAVSNPHPWIVNYCNLISFWEKFGMNYHDIMKLPYETFYYLKKVMHLDNDNKNKSISSKNSKGVKF